MGDYPSLLPFGVNHLNLQNLRQLCVTAFPLSPTRSKIMDGFEYVFREIEQASLEAEIILNGSFLTKVIDPNDIDFAVGIKHALWERSTRGQESIVRKLREQAFRESHFCDSYIFFEYEPNHTLYDIGVEARKYWLKQFGFSRQKNPKGIAIIRTNA